MCRDGCSGVLGLGFRDYGLGFGVSELRKFWVPTPKTCIKCPKNPLEGSIIWGCAQ